ncbi:unnamed protein product, partial [Lymnaea stagnalis]
KESAVWRKNTCFPFRLKTWGSLKNGYAVFGSFPASSVPAMSSTTTQQDKDDHPVIYTFFNITLWLCMLIFIALPFGIVSSLLIVIIRPFSVVFPESDVFELADFLELCQYMPELCMSNLLANTDFLRTIDGRRTIHIGTPV